jgi:hypothetical protein
MFVKIMISNFDIDIKRVGKIDARGGGEKVFICTSHDKFTAYYGRSLE